MPFVPMNRREAAAKRKSQPLSYTLRMQNKDNSTLVNALSDLLFGLLSQTLVNRIRKLMHVYSKCIFEGYDAYDDRFHHRSDEEEINGRNFEVLKKELITNKNSHNLSVIECIVNEGFPYFHSEKKDKRDSIASEINELFVEYRIGYKLSIFEDHYRFIKIEDTFIDSDLTQPTLEILENPIFTEARRKYFEGFKKWQEGKDYGEAIRLFYETLESFLPNVYSLLNDGNSNNCKKVGDFFKWFKGAYHKSLNDDEYFDIFSKQAERFVSGLSNQAGRRHASAQTIKVPESEMILVKNMVSSLIVYFGKFMQEQGKLIKVQKKTDQHNLVEDDISIPDFSDEDIPFS